jgi:IS4 transposase
MEFIKLELKKDFIFPLKSNRLLAASYKDKLKGKFFAVEEFELELGQVYEVYIQGLNFPVLLTKQIFKNKDGSQGIQYLVTSDLTLSAIGITTIYKKRWKVEVFHKSLKSNLGLAKSPTHTKVTQNNHFFSSIVAFYKLECLAGKRKLNHFALKSKLYFKAMQASLKQLEILSHSRA